MQATTDLSLASASPSVGVNSGSYDILLNGLSLPYAGLDSYAQQGLKLWFDGVYNVGANTNHNPTATFWKELVTSKNIPISKASSDTTSAWTPYGYNFKGTNTAFVSGDDFDLNFINGATQPRTVEVIYRETDDSPLVQFVTPLIINNSSNSGNTFWIDVNDGIDHSTYGWAAPGTTRWNPPILTEVNHITSIQLASSTNIANSRYDTTGFAFLNGEDKTNIGGSGSSQQWTGNKTKVSLNRTANAGFPGELLSVRIYNRILTPEEREHNYQSDLIRFISPPKAYIGLQTCTLIVTSASQMKCTLSGLSNAANKTYTGTIGAAYDSTKWVTSSTGYSDIIVEFDGKTYKLSGSFTFQPASIASTQLTLTSYIDQNQKSNPALTPRDINSTMTVKVNNSNLGTTPTLWLRPSTETIISDLAAPFTSHRDIQCTSVAQAATPANTYTCTLPRLKTPADVDINYTLLARNDSTTFLSPNAFKWNNTSPALSSGTYAREIPDHTKRFFNLKFPVASYSPIAYCVLKGSYGTNDTQGYSQIASDAEINKYCPVYAPSSAGGPATPLAGATGWVTNSSATKSGNVTIVDGAVTIPFNFDDPDVQAAYGDGSYSDGEAIPPTVVTRNGLANVDIYASGGANVFTEKIHSVTFDRNSDAPTLGDAASQSANIPQWPESTALYTQCIVAAGGSAEAAKTNPATECDQKTLYALAGTTLGALLPANPTLNNYTSGGWYYASSSATPCNAGVKPGYPSTVGENTPGNGTCTNELLSDTPIIQNVVAFQKYTYHPIILDFNPKKGLKTAPTTINIIGEGFIPWGYTLETAKADPNFKLKIGAAECASSTLMSDTEAQCVTNGGEGSGKLTLENSGD